MSTQDTIAAVATPMGSGGIGVIRISGPDSLSMLSRFFRSSAFDFDHPESHRLYSGTIFDPFDEQPLDHVLVAFMRSPHSYTGEDVIELNCHGGSVLLQKVLEIILGTGARLADPGEFTRRAFLNGRMDLTQAEAVIELIGAQTESSLKLASRQLCGALGRKAFDLRSRLVNIAAQVEACIDFPEDDLEAFSHESMYSELSVIQADLKRLISTYEAGALYRSGLHAVIVGKPNVGKSSILNSLLGDDRAIVASEPGTTRDVIRETLVIKGIPVRLHDTAGIHSSSEVVEQIGIQLAITHIDKSDLVLLVLDGSSPLDQRDFDIISRLQERDVLVITNKSDLPQELSVELLMSRLPGRPCVQVSALNRSGIDELYNQIYRQAVKNLSFPESDVLLISTRHKTVLQSAHDALSLVCRGLQGGASPELLAVDLQASLGAMGELTGQITTDELLDSIFSKFCIGK